MAGEGERSLRAADPIWLGTVVFGGQLIRVGAVVAIVCFFGGRWIAEALADLGVPIWSPRLLMRGGVFGSLCVAIAGAWLVASLDPSESDDRERGPLLHRCSVLRSLLAGVGALLALRLGFDPLLPPIAAALVSVLILVIGFTALRGVGGIVAGLVKRCSSGAAGYAKRAGPGGAWLVLVAMALVTACPFILLTWVEAWRGGGGTLVAAAARTERLILSSAAIGVGLFLISIANPLQAIRAERDAARDRLRSDPPDSRCPGPPNDVA